MTAAETGEPERYLRRFESPGVDFGAWPKQSFKYQKGCLLVRSL
jgi:hypothetical protein